MSCLACAQPSPTPFCDSCAELDTPSSSAPTAITRAHGPARMAQDADGAPPLPARGRPTIRSSRGSSSRPSATLGGRRCCENDAAIQRANTIPGGFCAGFGADAAAIACGIAVSVIEGATVKAEHAIARSLAHTLTGQGCSSSRTTTGTAAASGACSPSWISRRTSSLRRWASRSRRPEGRSSAPSAPRTSSATRRTASSTLRSRR